MTLNRRMSIMHCTRLGLLMGVLLFLSGCAGYPLNMTEKEWNALTPEQRTAAYKEQEKIDRYDADAKRCRKEAEQQLKVRYPQSGFGSGQNQVHTAQGEMDIPLGGKSELFRRCMVNAGWEVQLIIKKDPWVEVPEKR